MVNTTPLISVIVPTYNSENTIRKTLNSIADQSYSNLEVIVIDDNSKDSTVHIAEEFKDKFNKFEIVKKHINKGVADSRNIGISKATGKYIAFIDSDDIWDERKISIQYKCMEENNWDFSYTHYYKKHINSDIYFGIQYSPRKITYRSTLVGNMIGCSTVMVRRAPLKDVSIPLLKKRNDLALWLKMLQIIKKGNLVDDVLVTYIIVPQSLSSGPKYKLLKYHYQVYRKSEELTVIKSVFLTVVNVFSNIYKRFRYSKEI